MHLTLIQRIVVRPASLLGKALAVLALAALPTLAQADCTITATPTLQLGSRTSFEARTAQSNAGSGAGGLACTGIAGILSGQYIYLSVDSLSGNLVNTLGNGDQIPLTLAVSAGGTPLQANTISENLAGAGLITVGGANGDVTLFVGLGAAANVSAGTYTATVGLRWHYATCGSLSALNICVGPWSVSPGVSAPCFLGLCTLNTNSLPGGGSIVTLTISLTVTPDCRFTTPDIDFGSAPFADAFPPVNGQIGVNCTKGETYSVGLGPGAYHNGVRRQMASGANRLQYDVFRPGNLVWNHTDSRFPQAVAAPGNADQLFPFEARIHAGQPTPPVGTYNDSLILDVAF